MNIKNKLNNNSNDSTNNNLADHIKQIDLLTSLIFNAEESNRNKLQFIKEELRAETYEINSKTIAAKILEYLNLTLRVKETEVA